MLAEPIKLLCAICDNTNTLDTQSYGILAMESPMHIILGKVASAMGYEGLMVKQEEAIVPAKESVWSSKHLRNYTIIVAQLQQLIAYRSKTHCVNSSPLVWPQH